MTLAEVLERARSLGHLGPGPVEGHIAHASAFGDAVDSRLGAPGRALDLGSGAGVPGLVLAVRWPESRWFLVESRAGRAAFLEAAASQLGVSDRVTVVHDRAETAGHDAELRGSMDLVTSRSFGPPAVTAECGSPFLRVGGALVVSEPAASPGRWAAETLEALGLGLGELVSDPATIQILVQRAPCPDRFPRRPGVPRRRPLG